MKDSEKALILARQISDQALKNKLVLAFAGQHPAAFFRACIGHDSEYLVTARSLIKRDQYIEAIKCIRSATGLGLKEAKDIADKIRADVLGSQSDG